MTHHPRVDVLGVKVSAINVPTALDIIAGWVERREPNYVCVSGVHGVMESWRHADLKQIHNRAGLVTPDGVPLVWISRWRGVRDVTRVYGPDLMLAACREFAGRGYRHFFYGGAPGVTEKLARRLSEKIPNLILAGTYCPPFRKLNAEEEKEVAERIRDARADIVWVGISTPRQEYWMAEHVGVVDAPVLIGVGAAFDFHAGLKRQAPLWMQRSGLEWLFRLLSEPRRLWKRYLVNNPQFVALVMMESARGLRQRR